MVRFTVLSLFTTLFLAPAGLTRAEVKLPKIFGDQMVIQRDLAVPVWGTAAPDEKVTVRFAEQEKTATADKLGRWTLKLDPMVASDQGRTLEVAGANTVQFKEVLVGDVWVCSGQSNMEFGVGGSLNNDKEIPAAQFPLIRLFGVAGHITAPTVQQDLPGQWRVCAPQTVGSFTAVGYFFGRRLHQEVKVPIGLIGSSWGGTRIEPWTPAVGFRGVPQLQDIAKQADRSDLSLPETKALWHKYLEQVEAWVPQARAAVEAGLAVPPTPASPGPTAAGEPTAICNAMIHPLAPFGIRGAIWYQGEANGGEGESYYHKMQALIGGWRKLWGQGDFAFYFVQLANWQKPNENPAGGDGWARVREAQIKSLSIPNTGMAVIIDIGDAGDIHPRNKQDVGYRLAQWALHQTYERKDVVPSGPLYREMKVEGSKIRLSFDHVGGGLMVGKKSGLEPVQEVKDGKLKGFAIADKDKKWAWADAAIDGQDVLVSSNDIQEPVAVRYAFSMNPEGANLYNKEGLPASPFRTDNW
jgi:sialate O-acetylesterase